MPDTGCPHLGTITKVKRAKRRERVSLLASQTLTVEASS